MRKARLTAIFERMLKTGIAKRIRPFDSSKAESEFLNHEYPPPQFARQYIYRRRNQRHQIVQSIAACRKNDHSNWPVEGLSSYANPLSTAMNALYPCSAASLRSSPLVRPSLPFWVPYTLRIQTKDSE